VAKRYLTAAAAAEYLGLTPDALYTRTRKGEIPHIRMGRSLRWDMQDLDLWMRRQRVDAVSEAS
jgi:excisionase family DNA binding protein